MSWKWLGRCLVSAAACLPFCLLAGCWSTVELNDQSFTKIMLLDKVDEGIEMTLEFPLPNQMVPGQQGGGGASGGQGGAPFAYVSKQGDNIGKAFRAIQSDLSRRVSLGQLRIIVIGRRLAEDGIGQVVDFIAREPKLHINSNIFVTEGNVKELASIAVEFERFPSDILSGYSEGSVTVEVTARDLLMANYAGGDLLVPNLAFGKQSLLKKKSGEVWMGTDGAAIFRNGRMVKTLNTMEMRGSLWILGELKDAEVNVSSPTDGKNVSFLVWHKSTRIKAQAGEQLSIQFRSKAQVDVLSSESDIDLENSAQLKLLEKRLGEKLEQRMAQAIAKSKEAKADVFQLGNYVRWRYPRRWKEIKADWREIYANQVKIEERVDVSIKRLGAVRKSEGLRLYPNEGG